MDSNKPQQLRGFYHFGDFRLDATEQQLWCKNELISLTPKQFELLVYLVENPGRVAEKNELLEAVWVDNFVAESTLARNISWLRKKLRSCKEDKPIIETVPKRGYRFVAEVTYIPNDENVLIIDETSNEHYQIEETITFDEEIVKEKKKNRKSNGKAENSPERNFSFPKRSFLGITILILVVFGIGIFIGDNLVNSFNNPKQLLKNKGLGFEPHRISKNLIKIGSIIHLRNQSSLDSGYLDAWGEVKKKPEFSIVPTEIKFVSTHKNPNRENGSGSWKIVSATGKKNGEDLLYGDRIHLQSMYPDGGYLDNCGYLKDMPVFSDFEKAGKFAVFTSYSKNRDNGTGTWFIGSEKKELEGTPVTEGAEIILVNGFPGAGFLKAGGQVKSIPAFDGYNGSRLVFIHYPATNRPPDSGIWTIMTSKYIK